MNIGKLGGLVSKAAPHTIADTKMITAALSLLKNMRPLAITVMRILAGFTSIMSGLAMLLISFSSGGMERDGVSRSEPSSS